MVWCNNANGEVVCTCPAFNQAVTSRHLVNSLGAEMVAGDVALMQAAKLGSLKTSNATRTEPWNSDAATGLRSGNLMDFDTKKARRINKTGQA